AYENIGDSYKAIECYEKALEIDPDFTAAWTALGDVYYEIADFEKAIESYEHAIQIDPEFKIAWYGLEKVYEDIGQYQKAIECHEKAIKIATNQLLKEEDPLKILKFRLAKGEITQEEFLEMKKLLKDD
ncbi:MAG: tetratricopeptide repeat protein, partial [Candidatus Helarchaeota archaeon]